jgi:AAA domain-containing protein
MSFQFRPAARENVSLLIGLAGASGSGKTYTAMRLAKGIAGDNPFCVIDTEAGRAKHYADLFRFDHGDFKPPFTPSAYADAILAADKAGYPVIVIDSFSHEHAGEGGILDMQEAEYQRMGAREAVKMTSWIKPKSEHRKMVSRLLQVRAHLILCFRAEEKIEMVKGSDGKIEVRKKQTATGLDGWVPICEKNLPYELTASFLLMASKPGVPLPIKLQEQHKALFPLDKPITEESGAKLAAWALGGAARPVSPSPAPAAPESTGGSSAPQAGDSVDDLFAEPEKVKTPKGTGIPGVDYPDERQQLEAAILAEKGKLERQPSAKVWDKICEDVCGTTTLSMADPSALSDLLSIVKGLLAKDREAIARVKKIMGTVAA